MELLHGSCLSCAYCDDRADEEPCYSCEGYSNHTGLVTIIEEYNKLRKLVLKLNPKELEDFLKMEYTR